MNVARWIVKLSEVAPSGDGHWRRLDPGEQGKDQTGNQQVGRTWVKKNLLKAGQKPFAHQSDFFKATGDVKLGEGIIAAHGTGCLSGDTEVKVNRAGNTFTISMRELHSKFNGISGRWSADIQTTAQCHIDGSVRLNQVVAVYETGRKETFEVEAHGHTLRATADHRFETPGGFKPLLELSVGDLVLVRGPRAKGGRTSKPRYAQVKLAAHPYASEIMHEVSAWEQERYGYSVGHILIIRRVPRHRLVMEAHLSGLSYTEFVERVRACDHAGLVFLDPATHAVHHGNRNSLDDRLENLEVLTHGEHQRRHAEEGTGANVLEPVIVVPIARIDTYGEEVTYDLTMLSPHNNYVANGFVVHNSGKTFSAIGAFEELKGMGKTTRALVLAPAGLRANFLEKGVHRFTTSKAQILDNPAAVPDNVDYAIVSYDAFRKNPQAWMDAVKPDTIIADEVHRAANPDSVTNKALWEIRPQVKYFMGLTASSSQNNPAEIVPLVQLASGRKDAPYASPKAFTRRHVRTTPSTTRGIFGGKQRDKHLVRQEELYRNIGPYVHYVEDLDASEKPREVDEVVPVEMSSPQVDLYRLAMKGIDPAVRIKVEQGEPVSQKEAIGIFTSLLRARQASNSLHTVDPRLTPEQASEQTPKIRRILDDADDHIKKTPDGQVIMYTNVVHGGVDVLEAGLKKRGIPYGVFSGKGNQGVTEETRQQAVEDYLAGKNKVIVITGAGAEGLSLGNTTMVQLVDGHYNPERINQAKARGIRAGGLSQRAPEDRKVMVRKYVSTLPKTFWQKATFGKPDRGVDEFVYLTAERKARMNRQLRDVLARRTSHEEKKRESTLYRVFGGGP